MSSKTAEDKSMTRRIAKYDILGSPDLDGVDGAEDDAFVVFEEVEEEDGVEVEEVEEEEIEEDEGLTESGHTPSKAADHCENSSSVSAMKKYL